MKNVVSLVCLMILCGCSTSLDVDYRDTIDGGCLYTEIYRPRRFILDFFGLRDNDLKVLYQGVDCQTIVKQEVKDETHKKPYNSVQIVHELPIIEIENNNN